MAVEKDKIVSIYATKTKAELEALTEANVLGFPTDSSVITFGDREYGVGKEYHLPARVIDGNSLSLSNLDQSGKKVLSYSGMNPETGATESMSMAMPDATTTGSGLMSAGDKTKLNGIQAGAQVNAVTSVAGRTGAVTLSKNDVGLSNVSNDAQVKRSEMGSANGVATLGSDGKVPSAQLPSYVDDVLEYANKAGFPATGESGKIYVAKDTNLAYRWSGTAYVEISPSVALGETASTAYPGNKGKQNATDIASLKTKVGYLPDYIPDFADIEVSGANDRYGVEIKIGAIDMTDGTPSEFYIDLPYAKPTEYGVMSPADKTKLNGIQAGAQVNAVTSVAGRTGAVTLTKNDVGLGNVTNESKATMFTNAALTGTPTAPTAAKNTNNTQIATTAFVHTLYDDLDNAIILLTGIIDGVGKRLSVLENALKVK